MAVDMAVAATAYAVANALGATPKVMLSLFEAGLVESGFRNLDYGDRDSLGYLQQRPSQGWPDPMNVETATRSYLRKAIANDRNHPGYTAGQLAQSVQISAFPERYDQREQEARSLLDKVSGGKWASGTGGAISGVPSLIPAGNIVEGFSNIAGALQTMAGGVVNIGGLATQLTKLALPTTVVRAVAGGMGIILILIGIATLGREAKA